MGNTFLMMPMAGNELNNSSVKVLLLMIACFVAIYFGVFRKQKKSKLKVEILTEKFLDNPFVIEVADRIIKNIEQKIKSLIANNDKANAGFGIGIYISGGELVVDGSLQGRYSISLEVTSTREQKDGFIRAVIIHIENALSIYKKNGLSISIRNESEENIRYELDCIFDGFN